MVTFTFAFLGFEGDIPDLADRIAPTLDMSFDEAEAMLNDAIDVEQEVVLQLTSEAFIHFMAALGAAVFADQEYDGDEFEIDIMDVEPDPVVYTINTVPRQKHPRYTLNELLGSLDFPL